MLCTLGSGCHIHIDQPGCIGLTDIHVTRTAQWRWAPFQPSTSTASVNVFSLLATNRCNAKVTLKMLVRCHMQRILCEWWGGFSVIIGKFTLEAESGYWHDTKNKSGISDTLVSHSPWMTEHRQWQYLTLLLTVNILFMRKRSRRKPLSDATCTGSVKLIIILVYSYLVIYTRDWSSGYWHDDDAKNGREGNKRNTVLGFCQLYIWYII